MTAIAAPELDRLTRYLTELGAGAMALYKGPCFERRLATRLRVRNCTIADYLSILEREPPERERLLSALAVGVTSFFRNPSAWRRLRDLLASRADGAGQFRAWSAGCATGQEAYSVAMLLASLESAGVTAVTGFEVVGSDLDARSLEVAKRAVYPRGAAAEIAAVLDESQGAITADRFEVDPAIARRVKFERADLTDSTRVATADLVVCRNVLIYFGEVGQSRLLDGLIRALRPGGLLMLGKAELAARELGLIEPVDSRERIYRRCR